VSKNPETGTLVILFLGVLMGALDIAVIAPAFTRIQEGFHITERALVWIFTIYVLCNLISTPFIARLSDQWGRKKMYIASIGLFAVGSFLVAISWNFSIAIIGRAIQGFGSGGIYPLASSIIGDIFPEEKKGRALGLLGSVYGIAFILGPVVGGLLLLIDWHLVFLINIPLAVYVIVRSSHLLPSVRMLPGKLEFDWEGMSVLTIMLSSFAWGVNRINTHHLLESLASPSVWVFLLIPSVLLPFFIVFELRAEKHGRAPIIPVRLFSLPDVTFSQIISFGAGASAASLVLLPGLAIGAFHISAFYASLMLIPPVIALSISSIIVGKLVDRYGPKQLVLAGIGLMLLGTELLGFTGTTWAGFFVSSIILATGFPTLIGAPLRYIMLEEASSDQRAAAQGLTALVILMGQLLGSAFLGAHASSYGGGVNGYRMVFFAQGFFMPLLFICALLIKAGKFAVVRDKQNEGEDQEAFRKAS
jgi:MFS family permease